MLQEHEDLLRAATALQIAVYEAIDGELPGRLLGRSLRLHQNVISERIAALIATTRSKPHA